MNLEESDKFVEKQRQTEQKKKVVMISIISCAILVVLLLVLIIYIQYQDSLELKMFVDGTQISINNDILYQDESGTYVNVKTFAEMLGYTYTKGEYQKYNEDINSCYIKNELEVVAITVDEETFTKYIEVAEETNVLTAEGAYGIDIQVVSNNGTANTYMLEENVMKLIENQIYMPFEALTDVFNVTVDTSETNRIRIYTLPFMFKNIMQEVTNLGYNTISGVYENIRAIPYGMVVVGNGDIFGVISTDSEMEILSIKYENVEFLQNVQEFFIRGTDTVGLLDKEGNTIIKPTEYDDMSVLDEIEQLYLVKKDNKYGVLNRNGEIIIHVDYDEIGLNKIGDFDTENIRNTYLLHDKCIVVKLDSMYGLYDIEGTELLKTAFDGFGYLTTSEDVNGEDSVLLIPAETGIKGIVINNDSLYGIFDANVGDIIIPCGCTRIYSITKAAETTYYMEFAGEQIELESYLDTYNLKSEDTTNTENTSADEEEIEDTEKEENITNMETTEGEEVIENQ